jgi:pyrimidine-nucleoside phosphorylase
MVEIGQHMGKRTVALVTDMDQPLGFAVGNSLEVIEAIQVLQGRGPDDITDLCIELGAWMLVLGGKADGLATAKVAMRESITTGRALEKMKEFVTRQGGDSRYIDDVTRFERAADLVPVLSPVTGVINGIDAEAVGHAALVLGAGRVQKDSQIDLSVGVILDKKTGNFVQKGETLATLHSNDADKTKEALEILRSAYTIKDAAPKKNPLIYEVIE